MYLRGRPRLRFSCWEVLEDEAEDCDIIDEEETVVGPPVVIGTGIVIPDGLLRVVKCPRYSGNGGGGGCIVSVGGMFGGGV